MNSSIGRVECPTVKIKLVATFSLYFGCDRPENRFVIVWAGGPGLAFGTWATRLPQIRIPKILALPHHRLPFLPRQFLGKAVAWETTITLGAQAPAGPTAGYCLDGQSLQIITLNRRMMFMRGSDSQ